MNKCAENKCEALCCKYMALEIDTPDCRRDFENIYWFLAHKDVEVYIYKGKWHLHFNTVCKFLEDNRCLYYEVRPKVCIEHSVDECEMVDKVKYEKYFTEPEDLIKYIEKKHKNKMKKVLKKLKKLKRKRKK